MALIDITVDNTALKAALTRLVAELRNTTPIMHSLSEIMVDASQRAFLSNADPATGTAWAPLSKSRQKQRQNKGRSPTSNILQDTQQLISSVTGHSGNSIREVGPNFARVGTNLEYAAAHQFGADIQRKAGTLRLGFKYSKKHKRMLFTNPGDTKGSYGMKASHGPYTITLPARPFLGVNQTDIDDMIALIGRRLAGAFDGNAV